MLIVTTFDIPGYKVDAVLGEVMGMTVRSANIGANFIAGFKSIGGGEITEYTNLVYDSRNQVMQRMWEQCAQRGGNAVVGMRFDTGDIGQSFSEVCAYGTAVVVHPIASEEDGGTPQSVAQAKGQPAAAAPAAPAQQPYAPPSGQPGQPPQGQPPQGYGQPTYR
ncbi:MAG: YbjQ family protein [Propionibacteriaceae bacterium]|nr:YbjQ family protein [Propionibacteriaceae bacterium]